jgi:GNAT superfamily N-acetyltransferase
MPEGITYTTMDRNKIGSRFDWINIDKGPHRIGKIRALIDGGTLTIFSINIFPEFERKGYARRIIETLKTSFNRITADRVRHTAVGFWVKMGFVNTGNGTYVYRK